MQCASLVVVDARGHVLSLQWARLHCARSSPNTPTIHTVRQHLSDECIAAPLAVQDTARRFDQTRFIGAARLGSASRIMACLPQTLVSARLKEVSAVQLAGCGAQVITFQVRPCRSLAYLLELRHNPSIAHSPAHS